MKTDRWTAWPDPTHRSKHPSMLHVLVISAALLIAACGGKAAAPTEPQASPNTATGGGTEAIDIDALAATVDAMEAQKTVKIDFTFSFKGLSADAEDAMSMMGGSMNMKGHAEVDAANDQEYMLMEMPLVGEMEMVQDGDTVYMKSSMLTGLMGSDKEWVKLDATDMGDSGMGGSLSGSNDPTAMFEALRGVSSGIETVGTETIDGVETTHYRATIDLQKAIAAAPEDQQAEMKASLSELGMAEMPVDVWVDGDGLARRMTLSFDFAAMSGMGSDPETEKMFKGASMEMSMDMYDYGQPVNIQIPPANQVADMGDLGDLGGMGDMGGMGDL